jgi:chromate transporter
LAEGSSASAILPVLGTEGSLPVAEPVKTPTIQKIFLVFLLIGGISFGGGVIAYLRTYLVTNYKWINDETFIELLSISQSLPGLNVTNMAVLIGDRLQGKAGAAAAFIGLCAPSAAMMLAVGMLYKSLLHHNYRIHTVLHSVAAVALALVLATTVQLGKKSVKQVWDILVVCLVVVGINVLHQKVLFVLLAVGAVSVFPHMPRKGKKQDAPTHE